MILMVLPCSSETNTRIKKKKMSKVRTLEPRCCCRVLDVSPSETALGKSSGLRSVLRENYVAPLLDTSGTGGRVVDRKIMKAMCMFRIQKIRFCIQNIMEMQPSEDQSGFYFKFEKHVSEPI